MLKSNHRDYKKFNFSENTTLNNPNWKQAYSRVVNHWQLLTINVSFSRIFSIITWTTYLTKFLILIREWSWWPSTSLENGKRPSKYSNIRCLSNNLLSDTLPLKFWRRSYTKCVWNRQQFQISRKKSTTLRKNWLENRNMMNFRKCFTKKWTSRPMKNGTSSTSWKKHPIFSSWETTKNDHWTL